MGKLIYHPDKLGCHSS